MEIHVKKRNGTTEAYDPKKINALLQWSAEGYDADPMMVAMTAKISLSDGIATSSILQVLIEAAAGLISIEKPDFQFVTARLMLAGLRKRVWGDKVPPDFAYFIHHNHDLGIYADWTVNEFTPDEIDELGAYIDHERDFTLTAASVQTLMDKYLLQDRVHRIVYETPQFAYMLIAMGLHRNRENRVEAIKEAYDHYTLMRLNLPTPTVAGMRSIINSYASCALLKVGDNMDSIMATLTGVAKAVTTRYGIGLDMSEVRAIGAPIRGGEAIHSGVIPILKIFEATVRGLHQGGVRRGSATVFFHWWHYEMPEILMLKAATGAEEQRVRGLDYGIGFEGAVFFERMRSGRNVTLFSPHEVPELLATTGLDEFRELYEAAEANPAIQMKRVVSARDLMDTFIQQRFETTRFYALFLDHANRHCPWLAHVSMSNLCTEIIQPTIAMASAVDDGRSESGVCILSAINALTTPYGMLPSVCRCAVEALEAMIDLQTYFSPAAERFAKSRRSLGIGVTNVAAWLASQALNHDSPGAPNACARYMEAVEYYLILASVELAKKLGPCEKFHETKWSKGILPIDTYRKSIDRFVTEPLHLDWEWLREQILTHGMRHSTLTAIMPVESSSVIQNATNGIEPPRSLITSKISKSGMVPPQLVPGIGQYHQYYRTAFALNGNEGLMKCAAAYQKFTDMGISLNSYYDPGKYANRSIPSDVILGDVVQAYRNGLHTLYYLVPNDGDVQATGAIEEPQGSGCDAGGCTL